MRIRQSTLGSADLCLRRAGYGQHPDYPRGASEASIRGTAYHGGLEHYYWARACNHDADGYLAPTPELIEECYLAVEVAFQEAIDEYSFTRWETSRQECLDLAKGMVYRYFADACEWPRGYIVMGVEIMFSGLDHEGHELSGTADLMLRRIFDWKVILDDHKTSGKKWAASKSTVRATNQPALYVHAFSRIMDLPPEQFEFWFSVMTIKGVFERREGTPSAADIAAVLGKALNTAWQLENVPLEHLPVNTQSNLCSEKWCDYWDHCAFGASLDRPVSITTTASNARSNA